MHRPWQNEVPDWLAHRAATTPDRIAVIIEQEQYTFSEIDRRVARLCAQLTLTGVCRDDRVALLMQNSIDFIEMVHALARIGAVLVPLNVRLTPWELANQLQDAGCTLLLCDETNEEKANTTKEYYPAVQVQQLSALREVTFSEAEARSFPRQYHFPLDGLHSILFTSGTTGRPKGALLTYGNHLWSALSSALNLGLHEHDRWLACLPFYHVGGLSILFRSVLYGIPVIVHETFRPDEVNRSIDAHNATIISVVSNMLARMLADRVTAPYPSSLRCVLTGGGPVPLPLLEECARRHVPVVQTYGLTETASQIVTLAPEDALRKVGSAGKPLFPSELRIVRDDKEAAPGEEGEIVVRGPTVITSYIGQGGRRISALSSDGWLHTGDWGYRDEEGYVYVLDRRSDLIVSGGENVYPAEIEAALLAHPGVLEAGVVGVPDERWGQVPASAVVLKEGTDINEQELLDFLAGRLARYKLPVQIQFVPELPRTASGKVQRHRLASLFSRHPGR